MSYLGLDIGGTKSRYEWWPEGDQSDGDSVSARLGGTGPSVHPAVHDDVAARLADLLRTASATGSSGPTSLGPTSPGPTAALVAMAGVHTAMLPALREELRTHGIDYPVAIVGDVLAAAVAGLRDGPGVLLWAGTGSFAIARGADGVLARVGGRGFAFGDEGSGYDLMRRAIIACLYAIDGRGRKTVLVDLLTKAFGAASPERLGAVAQGMSPRDVASRLPVLLEAFAQDDWVAADILENGVHQLMQLGEAALKKVGGEFASGTMVALGGGVFERIELVRDGLTRRLQATFGGELSVRSLPANAAATAAAWLAAGWHQGEPRARQWVDRVTL